MPPLRFPSNLDELALLATTLRSYEIEHRWKVLILFCYAYLYKQTFAIPGSALLNVLAGGVFGLWIAFPLVCLLTAVGATCCYMLSRLFGLNIVKQLLKTRIESFQGMVLQKSDGLFFFLLFLRLFPMTPNWLINIASPLVGVPIHLFFLSVFVGLMPYNFLCCQAGVVLGQLKSLSDLYSWKVLVQLAMLALAALVPVYIKRQTSLRVTNKPL